MKFSLSDVEGDDFGTSWSEEKANAQKKKQVLYIGVSVGSASLLVLVALIVFLVRRRRNQPIYDMPNGKFPSFVRNLSVVLTLVRRASLIVSHCNKINY